MRRRLVVAAGVLALAASVLASCRSNVGAAARVDGHRINESDVTKYLTAKAQAISEQDQATGQSVSVPARSFVLATLIDSKLFTTVLERTGGAPSAGDFSSAENAVLQGATFQQLAQGVERSGFKRSFAEVYLRERAMEQLLNGRANAGADVQSAVANLHPEVSVSPRYGTWDDQSLTLSSTPKDGLPSFLHADATYTPPPAPSGSSTPAS